ncbi:MAG: helix-turn-helix domain-containing protein [Desulfomonilaceae bacterium]
MSIFQTKRRPASKLFNPAEIAELLWVKPSTIRKRVHYGCIPHVKLGTAVRFNPKDIEQLLRQRAEAGRATLAPQIQCKFKNIRKERK